MSGISPISAPGWYNDSTGLLRWWDGSQWGPYAPQPVGHYPAFPPGHKDVGIAYLFLLLLGAFGAHHFYLNDVRSGVWMNILWWGGWATTFIGVGFLLLLGAIVWFIIDLFCLAGDVRAVNARLLA